MKIKYWPNEPGIQLNNAVVDLFLETEKKLFLKKKNTSNKYLYLDILNLLKQKELLKIILYELKELILDVIEINLSTETITIIKTKIKVIFINRVLEKFLLKFKKKNLYKNINIKYNNNHLTDYLLTYLIFGGLYIENNIFLFEKIYTPYNHVKILLEDFIIETSNTVIKHLIYSTNHLININILLNHQQICNKLYSSKRSITLFLNKLKLQDIIDLYIYDIKTLYDEKKKIWIMSSEGIHLKYIHIFNTNNIKRLNQIQVFLILWLEIKDLIIPKIEKFIIQIVKYFIYCSFSWFSNIIIILIRTIVLYLNK